MTKEIQLKVQQFNQNHKNISHELKPNLILEQYHNLHVLLKQYATETNQDNDLLCDRIPEEDLMSMLSDLERMICSYQSKNLADICFKLSMWKLLSVEGIPKHELNAVDYIVLTSLEDCEKLTKVYA